MKERDLLGKYVKLKKAIYTEHVGPIGRLVGITIRHPSYVQGETSYIVKFDDTLSVESYKPENVKILSDDEMMVELL